MKKIKSDYLKGSALNPNISAAIRYKNMLDKLISRMALQVESELKKLYKTEPAKEHFAMDDTIGSQARILTNALTKKFNDLFSDFAKPIAEKVSQEANKSSSVSVRSGIKAMSEDFTISPSSLSKNTLDILNATITENVALIKSISQQYLSGVQQAVMRSITTGNGLQDLIPYLQKSKEITYRRARFIAYDQTRKAFNNLSTVKMQNLGLDEYEWLHTGGSNHPRKLHIELSGRIFSFANPPKIADNGKGDIIYGNPGELPGCRCRKRIILRLKKD